MRPILIPKYIKELYKIELNYDTVPQKISTAYNKIALGNPSVSIVIPAYNEEKNILQTLLSLSNNITQWSVEIIVVNNNSSDSTEMLVKKAGIPCVNEPLQGIAIARNTGLSAAKGIFVLNADADTIYPIHWIECMIEGLNSNKNICSVYSRFAFIPTSNTPRWVYFLYESIADMVRWINKKIRDEAMYVYGATSGFRREQALAVDGFNHPPGTNEDGWLALKLREKGFGKLYYVKNINALVWTTDRRIQMDGGLLKGIFKRIKRFIKF